ncbi:phage tail tape measure protein [[Clostridium] aminophilum]|nr:phage tail tape measure protein [[Clostridium] aminophilum]
MAGRIQGITVEIGGDTTKLQTALKGVNTEIRNTQSQLKDVDKLLKLDPGNTELLAQKHRLLGDAVKETKEKLETLKTASEQANEALKNGAITQNQYDGLQREIAETEAKLKSLEAQANQSSTALQNIAAKGEKLKTAGDNISNIGAKMMPVSAGVIGLGTAAVKTAADFDASMSKVAAVSGATGSDLNALRDKAREMGSKTKFSASEAADAMNYMAMAGWKTGDMLGGIDGIMNLAAASGEDLATTSDIVTDALTAFGLTASDSGHFADILAAASSNANTNVSMMGETFKYCAPIAGSLGFSAEDTAEAIGLMANAGIKSTQAGTALRTIMTNLSGDVKICGSSIGEVSIATSNADGSMRDLSDILADCRSAFSGLSESEKATAAESLVGKNAMSGFLALMNAGAGDVQKLSSAIASCDGSAEKMANVMNDNLAGQLTILKSQLQELAISFGELLMPSIRGIVGGIQNVVSWLNSMDSGTRRTIVTVALIVAALGPVLIMIGKVVSAIGTILTIAPKLGAAIQAVKGAFAAFHAVLLANPIALVVAAIAALVAGFIYLWNNCEEFRQFWIDLWNGIQETVKVVWEGIRDTVKGVVNSIGSFLLSSWDAIRNTVESVWKTIGSIFETIWNGIQTVVITVVTAIASFLQTAWNGIRTVISAVLNAIKTVVTTIWNGIKSVITTIVEGIRNVVTNAWNNVRTAVTSAANAIRSAVTTAFSSMLSGIKNVCGNIYGTVKGGFDKAIGFVKGLASQAFHWGADFINGIVKGIRSMIGKVGEAVSDVAEKIRSFLHFSVPDEGPLTDYESWMPDFVGGLAKGIERSRGMISGAVSNLAGDLGRTPYLISARIDQPKGKDISTGSSNGKENQIIGTGSGNGGYGDIVIPVYLGGSMIDEIVVTAQQRMNLKSGGR